MRPRNTHNRILLNKNSIGQVVFCEDCDVAELDVGAVRLKLSMQNISLIQDAPTRLCFTHVEKARFDTKMVKIGSVH